MYILNDLTPAELENFYRDIGKNVKSARKEKKISQMQLALAIGHNSVGHIAKAELYKYDKHFSLEQLFKISRVLDVSLHDLIPK
ncbi:MAG: helix-turn-helix transcriptional regulator [Sulfurimonas sp.]|nr:helix-turn-helix transcriptional regulator [Sulfurimonas sp.]